MKYVLMFVSDPDEDAKVAPEDLQADYKRIYEWFGTHAEHIVDGGAELLGKETATSVRYGADGPVVVDGPFNEAKEVIGGFSILAVADMDAAIAIARTWPSLGIPGTVVEIRPMVEDYSQFEEQ